MNNQQSTISNPSGELIGWHGPGRQLMRLAWSEGRIVSFEPAPSSAVGRGWIAPPLVDLQINGFAGIDFQRDDITPEDLLRAVGELRRAGCTRFFLTLITDEWPRMTRRFKRLRSWVTGSADLRVAVAGWHIEGPFLSAEAGFHGAHDPRWMLDPTRQHLFELRELAGDDPLLLTVAPERLGALDASALAVSLGMKISLGHTDAPASLLREAVNAGASGFTHLGNGCPQQLDRHDNILWRVLEIPELMISLIPDRIHVSPSLFRLIHRLTGTIYYTTDAMAAAGAPPGRYTIGAQEVDVGTDGIVRQPGKQNYAGSALRPADGVFRAAAMLRESWSLAWQRASTRPATWAGLPESLKVGAPADFCLLTEHEPPEPPQVKVYVGGAEISGEAQASPSFHGSGHREP